MLEFGDSVSAREFKENKDRWRQYMQWVDDGEHVNIGTDRIAWIRIVGLPLNLWGQKNFAAITKEFGETIEPFDEISRRVDLSCAKIGILTDRRTRINEEVYVEIEGQLLEIGVIEFDEDWFPFKFDPRENYFEDDYGRDVNVNDVFKTSPEQLADAVISIDEPEEGEIRNEEDHPSPATMILEEVEDEDSIGIPEMPAIQKQSEDDTEAQPVITLGAREGVREDRQSHEKMKTKSKAAGKSRCPEVESPPRKRVALMAENNTPTPFKLKGGGSQTITFTSDTPNEDHLLKKLPVSCFGPFTATFHPGPPPGFDGSLGKKKKKLLSCGPSNSRIIFPSMASLSDNVESNPPPALTLPIPTTTPTSTPAAITSLQENTEENNPDSL
ncbi:hypothetical protein LXL04_005614 [Taraxacum kok-saghyz]